MNKLITILTWGIILLCASCGGSGEDLNDSIKEIIVNNSPIAQSLELSGTFKVGSELYIIYQYSDDDNDLEGDSVFTWFKNGEVITGEILNQYIVKPEDDGASISASVLPVALSGTLKGVEVFSDAVDIRALKEFTLRTSCPYYIHSITNEIWPSDWTSQAENILVEVVDDYGNVLEELIKRRGDGFTGNSPHWNGHWALDYRRDDYNRISKLLRESKDNLLFTCTYINHKNGEIQRFKQLVSLEDVDIWEPKIEVYNGDFKLNQSFFEISLLSDLHYQVYLFHISNGLSKQKSISIADKYMDTNFQGTVYKPQKIQSFDSPNKIKTIRAPDSIQAANYKRLQITASDKADNKIEVLNELIGLNVYNFVYGNNGCIDKIVCALFIDDAVGNFSQDPAFENELTNWEIEENLNSVSIGSITTTTTQVTPRRNNLIIELEKSDHGEDIPPSQLEVFQIIKNFNLNELDDLFFMVDSVSLEGGCKAFGGYCLSSGFAGYFVCFLNDDLDTQLGCILIGNWSDPITIPIYIGDYFKIESGNKMYYQKSITTRYRHVWNLQSVINNHLPYVRENLSLVDKIIVGAVVGEFVSPGDYCQECFGRAEVKQLGLYKIKLP